MPAPVLNTPPVFTDPRTLPDQTTFNNMMAALFSFFPTMYGDMQAFITWLTGWNNVHLGGFATPPTTNNAGGALVNGQTYLLTTTNKLYVRSAGAWVDYSLTNSVLAFLGGLSGATTVHGFVRAITNYGNTTPTTNMILNGASVALTSGVNNTALGEGALAAATTASQNTCIGWRAGAALTASAFANTFIGCQAGKASTSVSGQNTFLGFNAGFATVSGSSLTFVGSQAGLGAFTGGNLSAFGYNAQPSAAGVSNEITWGNSAVTVIRAAVTSITALSDERFKTDFALLEIGLDFILALKPKWFTWNGRGGTHKGLKDLGFTAQDLDAVQEQFGVADSARLVYKSNPEKLEANYGRLIPFLVGAIQDQNAKILELESKVEQILSGR